MAASVVLIIALVGPANAYPTGWTSDNTVTAGTGAVDISVKGNTVHLVYENGGIYYRRSADKGLTWSSTVRIDGGTGVRPQVTTGSGNAVFVAYVGQDRPGAGRGEALVRRSPDAGQTWDSGYYAYAGSATDSVEDVAATHGSDNVSLTWSLSHDSSPTSIYWSALGAGADLSAGQHQVTDSSTQDNRKPRIASDGASVFVAHMGRDLSGGELGIHCMRFDGASTSRDFIAFTNFHQMYDPDVSCQGSGLFNIVWTDSYSGSNQVCQKLWSGSSWEGRTVIYNSGSQQPGARAIPFSADNSVVCLDSTGSFVEWAMFGSSADILKGSMPTNWAADRASGGEAIVAARCLDGNVRVKRTDTVVPSSSGISVQGNLSGGSTYARANFGISLNGVSDDWSLSGIDTNGDAFTTGVTSIQLKCSKNLGGPWGDLPTDKGSILNNAPWSAMVDTNDIGDGTWCIKGILTDTAANTREAATSQVVLDKAAPTCGISTDPAHDPSSWRTTQATVTITASDTNLDHIEYKVQPAGGTSAPWVIYSAPFTAPEGRNAVFYRAIDKAGNSSDPNASLAVWVDTAAPNCSVVFPTTEAYPRVDNTVIIVRGSIDDGAGEATSGSIWIDGQQIYQVDNPRTTTIASPWNTDGKALGPHTIEIKGTDAAGHSGSSGPRTFQLENSPAVDWYFAEGNTRGGFEEYICVLDAGEKDAHLTFDLMLETGQVVTRTATIAGKSRATFSVRDLVGGQHDVSIRLHTDGQPVIAERPIYFNYQGKWSGGHDALGLNELRQQFYFAEGCTRQEGNGGPFNEWLCLQNPGGGTANVSVTYMLATGQNFVKAYNVGPHSRYTVDVNRDVGPGQDVSAFVQSDQPIAAERPMYFDYQGTIDGGHIVAGASAPNKTWYFAEGTTRSGFTEFITVQNPNSEPASLDMTFYLEDRTEKTVKVSVPKRARATYNAADFVGADHDLAAKIVSDQPVVAERPMYFNYQGKWTGGHDTLGATQLGRTFYLAEGTTRAGFDEWVTVFSSSSDAVAYLVLIYPDGTRSDPIMYPLGQSRRATININQVVGTERDVSVEIIGDNDIVVERPMYFSYLGSWSGGHTACGFNAD